MDSVFLYLRNALGSTLAAEVATFEQQVLQLAAVHVALQQNVLRWRLLASGAGNGRARAPYPVAEFQAY